MSQIKAFFEKAKSDENLMAKLDELGKKEAPAEEIISLAAEYGFVITAEEIEQAKGLQQTGELSEEELDKVSGGFWYVDRYNDAICTPFLKRTRYECVGFLQNSHCTFYTAKYVYTKKQGYWDGGNVPIYRHVCARGAFDYEGTGIGTPV